MDGVSQKDYKVAQKTLINKGWDTITRNLQINSEMIKLQQEMSAWLTSTLGEEISTDLPTVLADGRVLGKLLNTVLPEDRTVPFPKAKPFSFQARANVALFTEKCASLLGVSEHFTMTDLEEANMKPVLTCLYAVARVAGQRGVAPPPSAGNGAEVNLQPPDEPHPDEA